MRVSLIKNNKINNITLPNDPSGIYWITDFDEDGHEQNLICIEAREKNWFLISNEEYSYVENNMIKPYVMLSPYNLYVVKSKIEDKMILIYCSPIFDDTLKAYNLLDKNEVSIGRNNDNDIVYNNSLVNEYHAKLIIDKEKGNIEIHDNSSNMGTFINNVRVNKISSVESGDLIFIMGLKIIISKLDKDYVIMFNNPNNLVNSKFTLFNIQSNKEEEYKEEQEELDIPLYVEEDYFHRTPRFTQKIEDYKVNIDPPPNKQEIKDMPLLLTIGPMLTMSMMSLVMMYSSLNNVMNNGGSLSNALPSLVMSGAMFASVFLWPTLMRKYEKKRREQEEKLRQTKYSKYIEDKKLDINNELVRQSAILKNQFPTTTECQQIILQKLTRLWERRIGDEDFSVINAGNGTSKMKIELKYPEEHFTMQEDNLMKLVTSLGKSEKNINNVPVAISLIEHKIFGVIGNRKIRFDFSNQILLQLATFHSYDNMKFVILTNNENSDFWEHIKILPHNWNNNKTFRYFGVNINEYKEIFYILEKIYNDRKEKKKENNITFNTRYIIINDCFNNIRNIEFIKNILNEQDDLGISLIIIDNKIVNIPDQCQSFVQLSEAKCEYFESLVNNKPIQFEMDKNYIDYFSCAKKLANIPIKIISKTEGQLPDKLGFLEMYDVGKIEQLNIKNRWEKNNPIQSLGVPVGYNQNGDKLIIDLHEKYHGPHGLIAGMTGSGKSEFLITYILSMALNFHPYEVQFILIDYKGGGLAGAFENEISHIKLPHLVGTITNLDANEIKRSLSSIESELKRRQRAFNEAREISGESTIDIYKYQKMYREGIVKEPVSHLFIISDEFAELKNQQPEFMVQLISTARIGRSLGVHLILATQKPSGVVDPQIWSNTRFRVCLRVQEKSDSNEVIKSPDAAYLKQTGRFYFQVGFNEIYELGQAAWAGGMYVPSEKNKKNINDSIDFINNIGDIIKSVETKKKVEKTASYGEELYNIVKMLSDIATEENIKCRQLWLPKIPNYITVNQLIEKYPYEKENFIINPIIGEYDDPNMQQQHLLTIPISNKGNAIVYGISGSGKENFVLTMIYSSMLYYLPSEVNYYIVDYGSETLRMLKNVAIVGDIVYPDEEEKQKNLFKMLAKEIEKRKKLFSNYSGNYINYCKNSGSTLPTIITIINNFEGYQESNSDIDDPLITLSREGSKYGIYFVLTTNTPNGIRFKLKQNFTQDFVLQQANDEDYTNILGNVQRNYPSRLYGRGIIKIDNVYEFQTAQICNTEKVAETINKLEELLESKYQIKAPKIPLLPEIVNYNSISSKFGKTKEYIVGLSKENLEIVTYNFEKNNINLIISSEISNLSNFVGPLINQFLALKQKKLLVINAEDIYIEEEYKKYFGYYDKDFNKIFELLYKKVEEKYNLYIESDYNKNIVNEDEIKICIIIGFESLMKKLSIDNKNKLDKLMTNNNEISIVKFILIDSVDSFKKLEYEEWFKNGTDTSSGIWVGEGINEQYTLKTTEKNTELKEKINNDYCFVVRKGKSQLVKYLSEFKINLK